MKKRMMVLFLGIFLICFVAGVCEEGQININSASAIELDALQGIGPAKAENIINARPFDSVDDLIKTSGIGPVTLDNIQIQGLACVGEEQEDEIIVEEESEEINQEIPEEQIGAPLTYIQRTQDSEESFEKTLTKDKIKLIELNPQVIKSEDYNENKSKSDYAKYGLGLFCVLLFGLFVIRKNKLGKNEFR